ncbi:MAG: tetratricopeptide repeat protein [Bacteroidetes bacterium]|nr:tetratricopeptide repeat protein [Bacteroidota bacterium]
MRSIRFYSVLCVALLVSSCGSEKQQENAGTADDRSILLERIKTFEKELYVAEKLDPIKADMAITSYSEFIEKFPDDSLTPDFLFKAGEVATANMQYKQAVGYYKGLTNRFPDYKYKEEAFYLQAHIWDNFLNNDDSARVIYEMVIQKFPTSHYAEDAKAAIQNLGKTDEQLIEEFKKKNLGK